MERIIIIFLIVLQVEILAALALVGTRRRATNKLKNPTFIDTSVLMDGRIMAAATTGFIPGTLVIPRSVIAELQLLADGADSDKRSRARHGLDLATLLQDAPANARVFDDGVAATGVDDQLLMLAKKYHGSICTIDFNLNKVATVENIPVLNINELAQQLRMSHLPGERVSLKIIQKGNDAHQGVGYLSDGTMVVVEQASSDVNKQVEVEFIHSLQTAAGRMLFAKKVGVSGGSGKSAKSSPSKPKQQQAPRKKNGAGPKTQRRKKPEDNLIELVNQQDN